VNSSGRGAFEQSQSHTACFTSSNEGSLSNQTDLASEILENPEPPISILLHCGLANRVEKKLTAPYLMSFRETKNPPFCLILLMWLRPFLKLAERWKKRVFLSPILHPFWRDFYLLISSTFLLTSQSLEFRFLSFVFSVSGRRRTSLKSSMVVMEF